MAAYIIFLRENTTDSKLLEEYTKLAGASLQGRNVKPLAFFGKLDTLEGEFFEGAVILECPSVREARDWYDSPEYQSAALKRKASSKYRVFTIEGLNPDQAI